MVPDNLMHLICQYSLRNMDKIGIKDEVKFVDSFLDNPAGKLGKPCVCSHKQTLGVRTRLERILIFMSRNPKRNQPRQPKQQISNGTWKSSNMWMANGKAKEPIYKKRKS